MSNFSLEKQIFLRALFLTLHQKMMVTMRKKDGDYEEDVIALVDAENTTTSYIFKGGHPKTLLYAFFHIFAL